MPFKNLAVSQLVLHLLVLILNLAVTKNYYGIYTLYASARYAI